MSETPEHIDRTPNEVASDGISHSSDDVNIRPAQRKLYQRNVSYSSRAKPRTKLIAVIVTVIIAASLCYVFIISPKLRKHVNTENSILYSGSSISGQPSHLWLIQSDGTNNRQLTFGGGNDTSPTFSSDGNQVAFLSDRDGGINQVYLVDADGKGVFELTHTKVPKSKPRFNPVDPNQVFYIASGAIEETSVRTGATDRLLPRVEVHTALPDDQNDSMTAQPATLIRDYEVGSVGTVDSPVAALIAVESTGSRESLAVMPDVNGAVIEGRDIGAGAKKVVAPLLSADTITVQVSPTTKDFLVAALGIPIGPHGPFISAIINSSLEGQLSAEPLFVARTHDSGLINPVISPDGTMILVEGVHNYNTANASIEGLMALNMTGKNLTRLVPGYVRDAFFSRDGKSIYFFQKSKNGTDTLLHLAPSVGLTPVVQLSNMNTAEYSPQT